jgi:recombination protein RecT
MKNKKGGNMNNFQLAKQEILSPAIKQMVEQRLGEKSGTFITSVLDLIGSDTNLMQCNPKLVIKECMKAASLDLPISKALGFAYVIPYAKIPSFQIGYKGVIQLALRTGQYKYLNAGVIFEGQQIEEDYLRGTLKISGKKLYDAAKLYLSKIGLDSY